MKDMIERQAAIDTLNVDAELLRRVLDNADIVGAERAKYKWGLGLIESYISDIKELPSVQPENICGECDAWNQYLHYPRQHWIPCSEKLPEANGRYLVTRGLVAAGALWNRVYIANYSDLMGIKSVKIWWQGNVGKSDFERLDDVIAWMPLPEPFKGGDQE